MGPLRKNISLRHDLLYLLGLSALLALIIISGQTSGWWPYLRVVLGLPFILFFPGYVLIAALFPKKDDLNLPNLKEFSLLDKVLSILLVLAIFFALGSIFYVVVTPKTGEKFTEFYLLGKDGKAEGYPRQLTLGEEGEVIAGVVNHEYRPVKYYVIVKMGKYYKSRLGPIQLDHGQKWERPVIFSAHREHKNLKVEFLLFRQGDKKPYRSLHLWVNVTR